MKEAQVVKITGRGDASGKPQLRKLVSLGNPKFSIFQNDGSMGRGEKRGSQGSDLKNKEQG